jgi:tryptophan halogenase
LTSRTSEGAIVTVKQVKKVVIAGGGTAGWMAAAALSKVLGKRLDIYLVESDEIGTVGVGEATIPTLHFYNQVLGLDEKKFLLETHGTFKLGIQFENWRDIGVDYLHAFGNTGTDFWAAGFHNFWLKGTHLGVNHDFGDYCLERRAAESGKFAHLPKNGLKYAYHLDATAYGKLLRKYSEKLGVTRVEGKISSVKTCENSGFIESLVMESGQVVDGDLFIDCTGFRGLLIEQTLHSGYEDWSHWLPCDRAMPAQTHSSGPPDPYTRAVAHTAGWRWRIPLQHRVGNGLVYCSRYMSDDEAQTVLLESIDAEPITDPRVIRFQTGRRLKQWNKNCIAVGLSSGFLEPLESTSIHLIQQSVLRLIKMFPIEGVKQVDVDEFNRQTHASFEDVRDFIVLHYKATERDDTAFWRHCRNMEVPDSLARRLNLFTETGRLFLADNELFTDSWLQVMIGQGVMPSAYHAVVDTMDEDELRSFLEQIRTKIKRTVEQMPTHAEYLGKFCGA